MSGLWIGAFVALWAFVLLLGLVVLGLLRRIAPVLERAVEVLQEASVASLGGLPVGSRVPAFSVRSSTGASFTDADLRDRTSIVLFLDATCQACENLVKDLRLGRSPRLEARLVVVPDSPDLASELAVAPGGAIVLMDDERALARTFDMRVVPQAFVIDDEGVVFAAGRPNDWLDLERLLAERGGGHDSDISAAALAS